MALNIKLNAFEGPFDLLFHLIDKNQIDINDIPIAELTLQYLDYMANIDEGQLDIASEFLVMAATLLSIKSRMLLPSKENDAELETAAAEDPDPREELVTKLVEYKKFTAVSEILREMQESQSTVVKRLPEDLSALWSDDFSLSQDITLEDLATAFYRIMKKYDKGKQIHFVSGDPLPLSVKIKELYDFIKGRDAEVNFNSLFGPNKSEIEFVVTFLAVLELIKMDKILAIQKEVFGEIVMIYRGDNN